MLLLWKLTCAILIIFLIKQNVLLPGKLYKNLLQRKKVNWLKRTNAIIESVYVSSRIYIYSKVYKNKKTLSLLAVFFTMPVRTMGSVIILV